MDFDALSKAYQSAKSKYVPYKDTETYIWKAPNPKEANPHLPHPLVTEEEVDYGIVKMDETSYIVVRSHYLGSLDYDVVCNCDSRHEARKIIRALNK